MGIPLTPPPSQTPPVHDVALGVAITNIVTNVGTPALGSPLSVMGAFNAVLTGTFVGTARLERTFDGGTTYAPVFNVNTGSVIASTVPMSIVLYEPEAGVSWRWNCTAYTSGTITARLSGSGKPTQF